MKLSSPEVQARLHLGLTIAWVTVGLAVTLVFPTSVLWIGFMSVWANAFTHLGVYAAARAERSNTSGERARGSQDPK